MREYDKDRKLFDDRLVSSEIESYLVKGKNLINGFDEEIKRIENLIDSDMNTFKGEFLEKIENLFENHKYKLKQQQKQKNEEFKKLLEKALELFEVQKEHIEVSKNTLNSNILFEVDESGENASDLVELGKDYREKFEGFERILDHNKTLVYYQALVKNFSSFESILSFYDDINKYPSSTIIKELNDKFGNCLSNVESILNNRANFTAPQIILDKPPTDELKTQEFQEEAYQERHPLKILNLVTMDEIKTIEDHKLSDITEQRLIQQKAGVKTTDHKYIIRVQNFQRVTNDLMIDLRGNSLDDESIMQIMKSVSKLKNQLSQKIYFSENQLNDQAVVCIFDELKKCKFLRYLSIDLRKNKIYHKVVPNINQSLISLLSLEDVRMYLGSNFFLPSSKQELKKALQTLPKIKKVVIKL